jgi:hypothetical protein
MATHVQGGLQFTQLELYIEDPSADLEAFRGEAVVNFNPEASQVSNQNLWKIMKLYFRLI